MDTTSINFRMEKADIQTAVTAILERLALTPPARGEIHTGGRYRLQHGLASSLRVSALDLCVRATPPLP